MPNNAMYRVSEQWRVRLTLDAVLPLQGPPSQQTLNTLLGSTWPSSCSAASSSLQIQLQQHSDQGTDQHPQLQASVGTAGRQALVYNLSSRLSSRARQQLPAWNLQRADPDPQAGPVRVQQYVGGQQGLLGTYNIHVTRPAANDRPDTSHAGGSTHDGQLYCLLQQLPWPMQLEHNGVHLGVWLQACPPQLLMHCSAEASCEQAASRHIALLCDQMTVATPKLGIY